MDLQAEKISLVKKIHDTENADIIIALQSVLAGSGGGNPWGALPDKVVNDVKTGMEEITAGKGVPHDQARESYKKWL